MINCHLYKDILILILNLKEFVDWKKISKRKPQSKTGNHNNVNRRANTRIPVTFNILSALRTIVSHFVPCTFGVFALRESNQSFIRT